MMMLLLHFTSTWTRELRSMSAWSVTLLTTGSYIYRLLRFILIDITLHAVPGWFFLNIQSCRLITVDDDFSNIDRHCLLSRTKKVIAVVFLSFLPNYVIHQSHVDWDNSSRKEIVINCYGHFHSYVNNSIHSVGVISLTENGKRF